MSYETYALIAGGIAFLAFIRFGVVMRRKVIKQEFKDVVRNDFRIDYDRAWAKYVPTPQDLMTYQQLLQNQQAQANMGYMMMNGAFAAGGTSVIADIARISSAHTAGKMKKRYVALYKVLFCCQKILLILNSPASETNDVVEWSAELAFQAKEAVSMGALPYDIHT